MKMFKVLAAVIVCVAGASAAVVAASASTTTAKTVVYGFGDHQVGWSGPAVRPGQATFGLAGEDGIKHVHWQDWGSSFASGRGLHLLFTGTGVKDQRATISLSQVRLHDGQRYFSHLVMQWTAKNGKRHTETLNWRDDKGVGWLWIGNYQ